MPEVAIIGEICGAVGFSSPRLYMHYHLVFCPENWHVVQGRVEGYTQVDQTPMKGGNAVFNHPLDMRLSTDSMVGWPRLQLEVWRKDEFDRSELAGYGMLFIPPTPGSYSLDCCMWRPRGSFVQRLSSTFLGLAPQLQDSDLVSSGCERYDLSTDTTGSAVVQLEVLVSGFADKNVRMGKLHG